MRHAVIGNGMVSCMFWVSHGAGDAGVGVFVCMVSMIIPNDACYYSSATVTNHIYMLYPMYPSYELQ